jgi:predicted Zn-dependent protease
MAQSEGEKVGSRVGVTLLRLCQPRRILAVVVCAVLVAGVVVWSRSLRHASEWEEALRLSGQGKFAEAEPLLKRALQRNERDVAAVRALALGYLGTGNDREAEVYLDRWCALQPDQPEPRARRMDLGVKLVKIEQAIADGERLLEAAPGDGETQKRVVALLIVAGRYADAERAARRYLERNPDSVSLHYLLAEACHLQGKDAEAAALLDPLLGDQTRIKDILLLRAILYCEADQPNKALPLLRRVLAEDPWNSLARYHLSRALARTGQTAEAEREAAELFRQNDVGRLLVDSDIQPDNLDLQARAAEVLLDSGRTEEGLRRLQRILARDPAHPAALRLLAAQQGARGVGGKTGP